MSPSGRAVSGLRSLRRGKTSPSNVCEAPSGARQWVGRGRAVSGLRSLRRGKTSLSNVREAPSGARHSE
jgi:hypothetical protein